ncbi:MAG: pirin family protein [Chitinophagaceae bacterium]
MKSIFHPSSERGHVNFGWLDSHHSFSFGHWQDPSKIHFGALRVLNDDIVEGGGGFGEHPHDNMEIISIPLSGSLAHKDSTGTNGIIKEGDVQIMSAGTGIRHSEQNASKTETVNFLQVWVFPKKINIQPHYDQKTFDRNARTNKWQIVVSPDTADHGVLINQDAVFAVCNLDQGKEIRYIPKFTGNGVYVFVIEGSVHAADQALRKRDAAGIYDADSITFKAIERSELLVIEVPMSINNA